MIMECVVITENSDIYEISQRKEVPVVVGTNGSLSLSFAPTASSQACIFFFEILHIG